MASKATRKGRLLKAVTLKPLVTTADRTRFTLYNLLGNLNNVLSNMNPADLSGLSQGLSGLVGHENDIRNGLADITSVGDVRRLLDAARVRLAA